MPLPRRNLSGALSIHAEAGPMASAADTLSISIGVDPGPLAPFPDAPALDPPDLIDDLPPFLRGSYEMQAVLRAIGNELARLESARQALRTNFFPASADALLARFEALFGLYFTPQDVAPTAPPGPGPSSGVLYPGPDVYPSSDLYPGTVPQSAPTPLAATSSSLPGLSLDQRRRLLKAYAQRLSSEGTEREWKAAIDAVAGTGWVYEVPAPYVLNIRLPFYVTVPSPTGLTVVVANGGVLARSYYYAVTAVTPFGETLVCPPVSSGPMTARKATLTWTAQDEPTIGYNVYRGVSASVLYQLASVTAATFVDTGTAVPTAQLAPTFDTSASSLEGIAWSTVREITPAHLAVYRGYVGGFLVGISKLGEDVF